VNDGQRAQLVIPLDQQRRMGTLQPQPGRRSFVFQLRTLVGKDGQLGRCGPMGTAANASRLMPLSAREASTSVASPRSPGIER